MPITLTYAPVGAIGALATEAGYGQYRKWWQEKEQRDNLALMENQLRRDLSAQEIAARKDLQAGQIEAQRERDGLDFDQRRQLASAGYEHDLTKQKLGAGFDLERQKAGAGFDQERLASELTNQKALFDHQLDYRSQKELDRLNEIETSIKTSERYTQEEKEDFYRQIDAKRAGLNPKARPISLEQWMKDNSTTEPDGTRLYRLPDGSVKTISPPKAGADKFTDPSVLNAIWKSVEQEVLRDNPNATAEDMQPRFEARVDAFKKLAGREVSTSAAPVDNSQGGLTAVAENVAQNVGAAFKPFADLAGGALSMAREAAVDPIDKMYPPEVAQQVKAEGFQVKAELDSAFKSGDPQAIEVAKAKAMDFLQRHEAPAVQPPSPPQQQQVVLPPIVTPGHKNTITYKGKKTGVKGR